MCFIGSIIVFGRLFKEPEGWVSWGNLRTGRCCCFLSCGRHHKWGRSLLPGSWTRKKTWRWCRPVCRSLRACTGAQSHCYWLWCEGPPSPELCRGSWTGQPLAPTAPSPSRSLPADPETPPGRRSPGLSSWPCCWRWWRWRGWSCCCCRRRLSWRLRWMLAGWKWWKWMPVGWWPESGWTH